MKNLQGISDSKKNSTSLFIKVILSVVLFFIIELEIVQAQTVIDIDGNVYNTVTIGTQVWVAENLKTTKYNDGTAIPLITDGATWTSMTTPGYCWYENNVNYKTTYGALYNWYTVNTGKLCPNGWHVPIDDDWLMLSTYCGESIAGIKLKEAGTIHWSGSIRNNATNESGFTALPGGNRTRNSTSGFIGLGGYWWGSTEDNNTTLPWTCILGWNYNSLTQGPGYYKWSGLSVRCIKDDLSTNITEPSISVIEIYPNPVSGILTIEYKNEDFATVKIYNSRGVLLTNEKAIPQMQILDFTKFEPGLYILEFFKPGGETMRVKVIHQ